MLILLHVEVVVPRDYAKTRTRRRSRKKARTGSPSWMWLLAGVIIGFFIVAAFYIHQQHPASKKPVPVPSTIAKKTSTTSAATDESPRFDFYTMLPEAETQQPVPMSVPDESPVRSVIRSTPVGAYMLQVASFSSKDIADQLLTQLKKLRYHAKIQSVSSYGKRWHRVLIGPFNNAEAARLIQQRLRQDEYNSILLNSD